MRTTKAQRTAEVNLFSPTSTLKGESMSLLRSDLESIQPYTRPASETASIGKVRLHMNEAAADWPEAARKALLERLAVLPFHRYPERQAELTERLRRRLGAPRGRRDAGAFQRQCAGPGGPGRALARGHHRLSGSGLQPLSPAHHPAPGQGPEGARGHGLPSGALVRGPGGGRAAAVAHPAQQPHGGLARAGRAGTPARAPRPGGPIRPWWSSTRPMPSSRPSPTASRWSAIRTCSCCAPSARPWPARAGAWAISWGIRPWWGGWPLCSYPIPSPRPAWKPWTWPWTSPSVFDQEIRGIVHRRERLRDHLGPYTAAPSAANYLYVDPDPAPDPCRGWAHGAGLRRGERGPGLHRHRGGGAAHLGGPGRPPAARSGPWRLAACWCWMWTGS